MKNNEIKQLIKGEIIKTKELIEMYKEEAKPVAPDCAIDLVSRNNIMNNMNITNSSLQQANAKLSALMYISTKADTQEFGKCVRCGNDISVGRILARPDSLYCIDCSE